MRYITALLLALSLGAAASLYTPGAQAAGVYVGVGVPAAVYAPPVVAVRIRPRYYAAPIWFGAGTIGPRYWGYNHAYYGYRYGYRYGGHGYIAAGYRRR
jgi:hypothetical protein